MTFFDGFDMNAIAYAAPALAPAFHLDKVMIGNLFSIGLVGTTIGGFALGSLGDRIGRRPTIILAVASFGVLALGFALVRSYAALLAVRLVDGIASGGMLPVCWALNIEYAPRRWRATIVTVIMVGYSLGISLAGPIAIWLMPQFGWQSLFVFGGGLSLLAALLLLPTLPESIRYLALEGARPEAVARVLRRLLPAEVPDAAEFVVSDEEGVAKDFRPALLFRDELRCVARPHLQLDGGVRPRHLDAAGARGAGLLASGGSHGRLDHRGGRSARRPLADAFHRPSRRHCHHRHAARRRAGAFDRGARRPRPIAILRRGDAHRLLRHRWAFRAAQHRRSLLSQHLSRQRRGLGDLGRQDRLDRGPWIAGWLLSTALPAPNIFAVAALCPAVFVLAIFGVGALHAACRAARRRGRRRPAWRRPPPCVDERPGLQRLRTESSTATG